MMIDIRTLAVVVGLVSFLQVTALMTQYWLNRGLSGQGWWVLGTAAWSAGFALNLLRDVPGLGVFAVVGNNLCFIGGLALLHVGMQHFLGQQVRHNALIAFCGAFVSVAFYFTFISSNFAARSLNFWVGMALMCFVIARGLWLHRHQPFRGALNYLIGVFLVNGLVLAALAPTAILGDLGSDVFTPTAALAATYFVALILSTLWTLGVVILVNQRLSVEHRESAESKERIFNTSPDAIVITRLADSMIVEVNDGFTAATGFTRAEAIGKSTVALGLWKDVADQQQARAALIDGGACENLEVVLKRKDGADMVCIMSARLLTLDGAPHVVSVTRDITARRQAEEALRISETRHRLLAENARDVIWVMELDGSISYVSPSVEQMRGLTPAEAMQQSIEQILTPASRAAVRAYFQSLWGAVEAGRALESFRGELEYYHKDGSTIWTEVIAFPLPSPKGGFLEILGVTRDISERKRAEEELRQANARLAAQTAHAGQMAAQADAANRAKSAFLANMSHELRTPLNAILGFSELMARDPGLTADQQSNLAIINRSGEHLLGLINDVLDMAKIDAGRVTLQEQDFDLHRLLEELVGLFHPRAVAKGLTVTLTHSPDVPYFVHGDDSKLRQVLLNLLGNAVKFTAVGSVDLSVRRVEGRLYFAVQDTGSGIPPHEVAVIFEPFVQVGGRTVQEGTGLGLSISRELVRLMGGELTVSSAGIPGEGSRFEFYLPLVSVAGAEEAGQPARNQNVVGLAPGQPEIRVLVAEDHAESRKLLADLLIELGFDVRTAENGAEAITVWEEWQPHLIWMDMRMPVMDGHEATRRIKAMPAGQQTVIVAVSASALSGEPAAARADGCDDFVSKPFREEEIVACLVRHLGVRLTCAEDTPPADMLPPLELAGLSPVWVEGVRWAATTADAAQLLRHAEAVANDRPALAAQMKAWVASFDYGSVLATLSSGEG